MLREYDKTILNFMQAAAVGFDDIARAVDLALADTRRMDRKRKPGAGRKPKPASSRKSATINARIYADLRRELEKAAGKNDRSLSEEVAVRLRRSRGLTFENDQALPATLAAYGLGLGALLLMIGCAMHETGAMTGFGATFTLEGSANWVDAPYAFDQAVMAADHILEKARPEGESIPPAPPKVPDRPDLEATLAAYRAHAGVGFANSILEAVQGRGATSDLQQWAKPISEMLGPLVKRMNIWNEESKR